MGKIKTTAIITVLLGIISTICIIYDYVIFTDTVYTYDGVIPASWRWVALGVIPVVLFHFSFFVLIIMLFDYLKKQKEIVREHAKLKKEAETNKIIPEIPLKTDNKIEPKEEIKFPERDKKLT